MTTKQSPTQTAAPNDSAVCGVILITRNIKPIIVGILSLALASTSVASTNLLTNPGFETGNLSGWTVTGKNGGYGVRNDGVQLSVTSAVAGMPDFFFKSWQNVRSGSYAAYGITAGDSQDAFREYVSFTQHLQLPAGMYQLGFHMGTDNEIGGFGISDALSDNRLGIFLDGIRLPLLTQPPPNLSGGSGPTNFFAFVSERNISQGAHTIEFRISGSGTMRAGISMDDAFVVAVPEPSSAVLMAVAIGGAIIRRRR